MSLSRLALRLAAVEALCPSANIEAGPWPTWAANRVYDSRIAPISDANDWREFVAQVEGQPLIAVYTEEQETVPTEGEYPADREFVELYVEIMIGAGATVEVNGEEIGSLDAPITDAQHEATLDMIEQQVRNLLDPQSPGTTPLFAKVAWELHHVKSVPMRDAINRQSRQAARTISLKLRVKQTRAYRFASSLAKPKTEDPADIANLPEPLLTVARVLEPSSPGGQLVRQIAKGQPPAPTLRRLEDIRIATNLNRGKPPTSEKTADLVSDVSLKR